jgi:hypothetical protein
MQLLFLPIQIKVKDLLSVLLAGKLLSFLFYICQHSSRHLTIPRIVQEHSTELSSV